MSSRLRKKTVTAFKKAGLLLKKEALKVLLEHLENEEAAEAQFENLHVIIDRLKKSKLVNKVITFEVLEPVIMALVEGQGGGEMDIDQEELDVKVQGTFEIVDAFKTPKFRYDGVKKRFNPQPLGSLHGKAEDQIQIYCERHERILQRILRYRNLRHAKDGKAEVGAGDYYSITTTQDLRGTKDTQCVFGCLTEIEEGKISLEDTEGTVEVDLGDKDQQALQVGFYTYNSFVLAEGIMENGIFKVDQLALPPYEDRDKALNQHPNLDFVAQSQKEKLLQEERLREQDCFVFLSNVHLDQPTVVQGLERLFSTYASLDTVPSLIVLLGNFTKERLGNRPTSIKKLKRQFDSLADMICRYPKLNEQTKFVFAPGPHDPNIGNALPRPGLSKMLTQKLRARVHDAHFPSSPFRIHWFTQEIFVAREDLTRKLHRNTVIPCKLDDGNDDLSLHVVRTIMNQATIAPVPLVCQPVYWGYDHALSLYPPPTAVVLGDPQRAYQHFHPPLEPEEEELEGKEMETKSCSVVNPGEFAVDFQFLTYYPAERKFEESELPRT